MTTNSPDVVVIGAGIVGCGAAYCLAKAGARVTIVERDSVAGHASGFALGGLSPLAGAGHPGAPRRAEPRQLPTPRAPLGRSQGRGPASTRSSSSAAP